MIYVIMADGKGTRWNNYQNIPKHLIQINGETLLARTTRLLHKYDEQCQVYITTHREEYATEGAVLYAPKNNQLEIDRFTEELITDDVCFLYGDTYYSEEAIRQIVETKTEDILFFGTIKSIIAVKVKDGELFRSHVDRVRQLFLQGKIEKCIGWQVYQSYQDLPFGEKQIAGKFILIEDWTKDFNSPDDLIQSKEYELQ